MFFAKRADVAAVLAKIVGHACAYTFDPSKPAKFCDCKYGGTNVMAKSETGSGCPELRCAIEVLNAMKDWEYARMVKRANKPAKKTRAKQKAAK